MQKILENNSLFSRIIFNNRFNQLIENGNFSDDSKWTKFSSDKDSIQIENNMLTYNLLTSGSFHRMYQSIPTVPAGHTVYIKAEILSNFSSNNRIGINDTTSPAGGSNSILFSPISTTNFKKYSGILTRTIDCNYFCIGSLSTINVDDDEKWWKYQNIVCFDLTEIFGAGYEPSVSEFERLFPNDYYPFKSLI